MLVAQKSHFSFKFCMKDMTGVGHASLEYDSGLNLFENRLFNPGESDSCGHQLMLELLDQPKPSQLSVGQ